MDFEKHIHDQAGGFEIKPREWVWPRVEAELDKKKRRRVAAWWWLAPLALLLAGGGWWLAGSAHKKAGNIIVADNKQTPASDPAPKTGSSAQQAPNEPVNTPQTTTPTLTSANNSTTTGNTTTITNAISSGKTGAHATRSKSAIHKTHRSETTPTNVDIDTGDDAAVVKSRKRNTKKTAPVLQTAPAEPASSLTTEPMPAAENPTPAAPQLNSQANTPDSAATDANTMLTAATNQPAAKKIKQLPTAKAKWQFVLGAGMSNNSENASLFSGIGLKSASADNLYSGAGAGTGTSIGNSPGNSFRPPLYASSAKMSFSAGVQRSQALTKKLNWLNTVTLQYQQMRQYTGNRIDSTVNTALPGGFTQSGGNNLVSTSYYNGGNIMQHTGHNLRLQLASGLAYKIINRKNGNLQLQLHVQGGVNLLNSYLAPDARNLRFIQSSTLYNNWFAGAQAVVAYQFKKGVTLGVTGSTDFTSSLQILGGKSLHWKNWQLQASVPIR